MVTLDVVDDDDLSLFCCFFPPSGSSLSTSVCRVSAALRSLNAVIGGGLGVLPLDFLRRVTDSSMLKPRIGSNLRLSDNLRAGSGAES